MGRNPSGQLKYLHIQETLYQGILRGDYRNGQRLPTETELAKQHSCSRPTVSRALTQLQREGFIERRAGSGTYVRYVDRPEKTLSFALLIPGLGETEIFEPICGHMAHKAEEDGFRLIWSGSMSEGAEERKRQIEHLARRYAKEKVDGIFFAPLERTSEKDTVNKRIMGLFAEAHIPVVLMDRDIVSFPLRSNYDLVGVDNVRIGYIVTEHLINHGCTSLKFVSRPYAAPTVKLRIIGYVQAIREANLKIGVNGSNTVSIGEVEDQDFVRSLVHKKKLIGIVCENDTTAARLMHHLSEMGYDIPGQVRVVGIDDLKYSEYLRVPLTTYRQPLKEIAATAVGLMLSRVADFGAPARTVYLDGELIVRRSCGCPREG
ncbi:MAG: substrate-binding domain-containing protein [Sedimentisphaerales bacterium]|jgi:DNA-binding LacI/PurR family transcriptional regulator|nr:substrate-binding domain-containing protein [Sedimentisphaerales bacterium]HOI35863.1 substrate-binding domain-containing protein [Bacillota bacterium]